MRKHRKSAIAGLITRILFYGLFLVGPCALTESHTLHVRMKQKCDLADGANASEKKRQEFKRKITVLDAVGMSAFGLWFMWLGFALWGQIKHIMQERQSMRNHKSAIISPRKHNP